MTGFMVLTVPLWVVFAHFIGDFVLQSNRLGVGKSKSNFLLLQHIAIVTACLLPFGLWFALANGACHFVTDYVTSRMTSKLWFIDVKPFEMYPGTFTVKLDEKKRHNFFVVIGADQVLHYIVYAVTWRLLV